ncbi:hypothetical protein IMZ48_00370 [Candidatus Bathyarchaeota archaeon]|nr:hypothetical protein [Candidatus Bathyarchaeota archaeon]
MTSAILDVVDQGMLVDSEDRWNSATTADHIEDILKNTTEGHRRAPLLIEEMLEEIEDDPVSFRERSVDSTVTSLGTISAGDNKAADDAISASKYDLLNQQILPTAPQGNLGMRRRNTAKSSVIGNNTPSRTQPGPPLPSISTSFACPDFFEPYTVFKLRESLDEFEKEAESEGGLFGGRKSFFGKRQASVKGKWKEDRLEEAFKGRDIVRLFAVKCLYFRRGGGSALGRLC